MFKICSLMVIILGSLFYVNGERLFNRSEMIVVMNMNNESVLPRNFRSSKSDFVRSSARNVSLDGLRSLNVSGSAQFSEFGFQTMLDSLHHPKNMTIIDLREESHGYINGIAVSWYSVRNRGNIGKSLAQIETKEKELLSNSLSEKNIILSRLVKKDPEGIRMPLITSIPLTVSKISTEEEMMKRNGLGYLRIPVTDANRPSDDAVDAFVSFMRGLPNENWVHFHCSAGRGRTTAFMVMYDMFRNAKNVSCEDIMRRQFLLGGLDVSDLGEISSWKYPYFVERYEFLKRFYEYCRSNNDGYATSWSSWATSRDKRA